MKIFAVEFSDSMVMRSPTCYDIFRRAHFSMPPDCSGGIIYTNGAIVVTSNMDR